MKADLIKNVKALPGIDEVTEAGMEVSASIEVTPVESRLRSYPAVPEAPRDSLKRLSESDLRRLPEAPREDDEDGMLAPPENWDSQSVASSGVLAPPEKWNRHASYIGNAPPEMIKGLLSQKFSHQTPSSPSKSRPLSSLSERVQCLTDAPFLQNGKITVVEAYSTRQEPNFELQIWRPAGPGDLNQYTKIGFFNVALERKSNTRQLPVPLEFKQGDVLGWYSPGTQPIVFKNGGVSVRHLIEADPAEEQVDVKRGTTVERTYSIWLTIKHVETQPIVNSAEQDEETFEDAYIIYDEREPEPVMDSLEVHELQRIARSKGIGAEELQTASDADNPQQTLIRLIRRQDRFSKLQTDLGKQSLADLKRIARQKGIPSEQIEEVDDTDDPKQSTIRLIFEVDDVFDARDELQRRIIKEELIKIQLQKELEMMYEHWQHLDHSVSRKRRMREDYDRTIADFEEALKSIKR